MLSFTNIEDEIKEFAAIYNRRPILQNTYGTESPHLFYLYFILKTFKPSHVIESGVYQGLSTWMIEQAAPEATVISIDIDWSNLKYKSDKVTYTSTDFNDVDWLTVLGGEKNCRNTIAFIDDHQDNYKRLLHAHANKIGRIIFEDNYPASQGDVLSLKKILSKWGKYVIDKDGVRVWYDMPEEYAKVVVEKCSYFECPPVYLDTQTTRWKDTFAEHDTKKPLFTSVVFPELEVFKEEQLKYGFIALCELKYL